MADKINVSEALGWKKTLQGRLNELTQLRNQNSQTTTRYYGNRDEKPDKVEPTYDAKALDRRITLLSREIRLVDEAIKRSNAATVLADYQRDDAVLGELE